MIIWTQEQLNNMKSAFLKGLPIKVIAKNVGKSVTATNKALSRYGIRQPKKFCNLPPFLKNTKSRKKDTQLDYYKTLKKIHKTDMWVTWDVLWYWLIKQKNLPPVEQLKKNSKLKILLIANRLRVSQNKPIFRVNNVTW